MSETVPYAPWWKLNINGHAIHVNDDGSYWWWDRTRIRIGRNRPHFRLNPKGSFAPRGRLQSTLWRGRCSPDEGEVTRAFTFAGLGRKQKRADRLHWTTCTHPENHRFIPPEYRRPGFGA